MSPLHTKRTLKVQSYVATYISTQFNRTSEIFPLVKVYDVNVVLLTSDVAKSNRRFFACALSGTSPATKMLGSRWG